MLPGSSFTKKITSVNHHSPICMEINRYLCILIRVKVNSDILVEASLSFLFHRSGGENIKSGIPRNYIP